MLNRISVRRAAAIPQYQLSAGFTQTRDAADVRSDIANITVAFRSAGLPSSALRYDR